MPKVSVPPKGVYSRMVNHVSNKTAEQKTGMVGGSATQKTAVGSGSRPTSNRYKIDSSNPSHSQMIRPKNKIEGTGYKG